MDEIEDFTGQELEIARQPPEEHYAKGIEIQLVDVELRLVPDSRELTSCPALYSEIDR